MIRYWTESQWRYVRSGTDCEIRGDYETTLGKQFYTRWVSMIIVDSNVVKEGIAITNTANFKNAIKQQQNI